MPLIYKTLTLILAFTGCIGIIVTGQLNLLMLIPGIAIIPGYMRFFMNKPSMSKWTIGGLSITSLFLFAFDFLILSGDVFIAVAHLTIVFQALKSFDLKDPWDHLQVYFMSLLQIIIASELTHSMIFGAIFVVFLIALVSAMVISHFMKAGTLKKIKIKRPLVFISAITLIITTIFFISAPRAKSGFWGKSRTKAIKTTGFSEKVDFGSFGEVKLDHTIIMRIELSKETAEPLYWRGITLDYFDGTSWQSTIKNKNRIYKDKDVFIVRPFSNENAIIQKIFLEPLDSDVIFGLGAISGVEIESRALYSDNAGSIFTPEKSPRRLHYTAYSTFDKPDSGSRNPKYLQLPSGNEKIKELTKKVVLGANTSMEMASRIENHLKTNYRYSLTTSPPTSDISPVEDFLFVSKQGYCEHYATSMVLMLRTIGIPSRIVTGFIGGEKNAFGGYISVRQSDAHSWVEAVIDGRWERFDPTPPTTPPEMPSILYLYLDSLRMQWYRYVINFSTADQKNMLKYISKPLHLTPKMPEIKNIKNLLYFVLLTTVIIALIFLIIRLKFKRYDLITSRYIKFRSYLKKRGAMITPSSTPSEVLNEAFRLGIGKEAADFIRIYEMLRFGGKKISEIEEEQYKLLSKKIFQVKR